MEYSPVLKYASKAEQDDKLEFLLARVREYYSREGDLSLLAPQQLLDAYAVDDLTEAARLSVFVGSKCEVSPLQPPAPPC